MNIDYKQLQGLWDEFLKAWPVERLHRMTLREYTAAGESDTFTSWIERRLDVMGSIWGGSSFKFGIFSRANKATKDSGGGSSYSGDYAWYTKYGRTQDEAFARVRSLVSQVAEAAARAHYDAINSIDLGEAYKWKLAFQYQDQTRPGVLAAFKPRRLEKWLRQHNAPVPSSMSELYRAVLAFKGDRNLIEFSYDVWEKTGDDEEPEPTPEPTPEPHESAPLNLILYGPPGTGKTYATTALAVEICDGVKPESRAALMARYRELTNLRRIRFVTFHPSFSYEEFVEGIRPSTVGGQVSYEVRAGVFKQIASAARDFYEKRDAPVVPFDANGRKLFKMSLGDSTKSEDAWVFTECIDRGYVSLNFAPGIDFSDCADFDAVRDRLLSATTGAKESNFAATAIHYIKNELRNGDLVLISDGNTHFRAIAEVTGPYHFEERPEGHHHQRPVRWLWTTEDSLPVDTVFKKRLSQASIYLMDQEAVKWPALQELLSPRRTAQHAPNCVLVIDEINRANVSKTLGELITLLEPSKRLGREDEQEVELPYSGDRFALPPNLFVIGTMNTADRSIALIDTALRRRFTFKEMSPAPSLLSEDVEGVNLRLLLAALNSRIESLFDRDHILGHTYLMGVATFDDLAERLRGQIIPLLQEYFFDDWRRIQQVFNDTDRPSELQIIQAMDAADLAAPGRDRRQRFKVNPAISPAAVQKIYS